MRKYLMMMFGFLAFAFLFTGQWGPMAVAFLLFAIAMPNYAKLRKQREENNQK
jgi:ABC-type uncharacterized transport system permease subunit